MADKPAPKPKRKFPRHNCVNFVVHSQSGAPIHERDMKRIEDAMWGAIKASRDPLLASVIKE